ASPDLLPFLKDRDVYIALDSDSKPKAKQAVNRSLSKHLKPLSELAKSVKVVTWDSKNKGLDDLLANLGVEALEQAIASSINSDEWLFEHEVSIANALLQSEKISPDLELDSLPTIDELNELYKTYRDIFLCGAKALGKSELGGQFVKQSNSALLPTPLESLAKNLASRFKGFVDYRTDCDRIQGRLVGQDGYVERLSFCVESIQAVKGHIENVLTKGAVIFNDELDLQLNSLATSSTHSQDGKRKLNESLYWEAQIRGEKTLSVSADLTNFEAELWKRKTGRTPYVIRVNTPKKTYLATLFFDLVELKNKLDLLIAAGDRVIIPCSRKSDAKSLEWLYRDYGAVSIHRDNANEPKFKLRSDPKKGFFDDPNQWLRENPTKILIVSPVLRSGFSIKEDFFDAVFCFYHADSISASTALQLSDRYRPQVPRFIFAAKSNGKFNHTTPEAILTTSKFRAKASQIEGTQSLDETDPYLHYQAADNWSRAHFRADIVARLRDEVESVQIDKTHAPKKDRDALRVLLTDFEAWQRKQSLNADNWSEQFYEANKDRRDLTEAELLAKQKYELANWSDRTPKTVTIEQIERDKKGRKRKALERLERQAYPELARAADKKSVDIQSKWGQGIAPQDVKHYALTQQALEILGVHELLDYILAGNSWNEETEITAKLANRLRAERNTVRDGKKVDALAEAGISLTCAKDGENNAYIGALLRWLGLQSKRSQQRIDGKVVSFYKLCQADLAITRDELTRRAERAIREGLELIPSHSFVGKLSSCHRPFNSTHIERSVTPQNEVEENTKIPQSSPVPPKSVASFKEGDRSEMQTFPADMPTVDNPFRFTDSARVAREAREVIRQIGKIYANYGESYGYV
ncbi:DUF3854 domain-containing protein, partial [Tumidithrix helvetica]|uniref:DUF3854 domain-containing protein n=1 Tax=Tumidithrix helvetica TaxID=3457545 RepID=UPI003CC5D307